METGTMSLKWTFNEDLKSGNPHWVASTNTGLVVARIFPNGRFNTYVAHMANRKAEKIDTAEFMGLELAQAAVEKAYAARKPLA
jgi:hypothetical protein